MVSVKKFYEVLVFEIDNIITGVSGGKFFLFDCEVEFVVELGKGVGDGQGARFKDVVHTDFRIGFCILYSVTWATGMG